MILLLSHHLIDQKFGPFWSFKWTQKVVAFQSSMALGCISDAYFAFESRIFYKSAFVRKMSWVPSRMGNKQIWKVPF